MGNLWVGESGHENEKFMLYGEPNRSSSFTCQVQYVYGSHGSCHHFMRNIGFTMGFVNLCANEASIQIGIKSPEANIPQLLPQALIYISHGCESFEKY
ncbi:hypothetical protein P8452_76426 [Trifolium repens]|nr:hypothetical protein P8452_76426 [Trifolium repens]